MTVKQMIAEIRKAIASCKSNERAVYEALMDEAEGWDMRLQELEEEEDGKEE